MKKQYLKIDGSMCSLYRNAMHANFHLRILVLLRALVDLGVVNLTEADLDDYEASIDAESDLTREARVNALTEELTETDTLRDGILSYLFNTILAGKDAPVEAIRKAAKELARIIESYRGIQKEADNAETQLIIGLIKDLRKAENAAYVTALNLDAAVDALEEANNKFQTLQAKRTASVVSKNAQQLSASEQRRVTDDYYFQLTTIILAAQLTCTDAEELKVIEKLIQDINGTINEFRTSYNMSKGIQKGDKPGESDRPVIPDEDEEPEEPTDPEEGEDDRPVMPEEPDEDGKEPGKDENGDDLPPIE